MFRTLETNRFRWRWQEYGQGDQLLFAFQGFNRPPEDFKNLGKLLGDQYTILSFELFFHGDSKVKNSNSKDFNHTDLNEAISQILQMYQRNKFEVIAYSFGGRLAMNCIEVYGECITGLYLMAPDALRFNTAFWFAVQTRAGSYLFAQFNKNPNTVIAFLKLGALLGFRDKNTVDFYISQVRDTHLRNRVFNLWNAHRKTVPDLHRVATIINKYQIRTLLFFGKSDTIIKAKYANRLMSKIKSNAQLILLESGHRLPEKYREISAYIRGS